MGKAPTSPSLLVLPPSWSSRSAGFLGVRWSLVELQGWLLRWSRSCLSCKLGNDDPQRTSRQRDEGFEVEQFERALGAVSSLEVSSCWFSLPSGENRVPFGTGVDSILDVVSLLKASLRRPRHYVVEAACLLVVEFFLAKIHVGEIHKFLSFGLLVGQRHVNRKAQRYKCNGKSSKDW
uniref:Uncharacterized protein n=1 Tax=Oryza barthii TaxID=65489 RepID=A0A0D3FJS8_9ORYZ